MFTSTSDFDGDGIPDRQEYYVGLDPLVAEWGIRPRNDLVLDTSNINRLLAGTESKLGRKAP